MTCPICEGAGIITACGIAITCTSCGGEGSIDAYPDREGVGEAGGL